MKRNTILLFLIFITKLYACEYVYVHVTQPDQSGNGCNSTVAVGAGVLVELTCQNCYYDAVGITNSNGIAIFDNNVPDGYYYTVYAYTSDYCQSGTYTNIYIDCGLSCCQDIYNICIGYIMCDKDSNMNIKYTQNQHSLNHFNPVAQFSNSNILSTNCQNGIVYDNGVFQSGSAFNCGYGWCRWVMKLVPPYYPYTINHICVALSRTVSGSSNWTFNIVLYDTTGPGGGPGVLIDSFANLTAANVPIWPTVSFFEFSNLQGIPALNRAGYYIGISYDPCVNAGHYVVWQMITSVPQPSYWYIQNQWTQYPNYTVLGVRAESVPDGILQSNNDVPKAFKLYNNYPNPFNPETNIKFSIPKQTFVTLKIYDILGREVTTLVNEKLASGSYERTFNATAYASGVYFYKLKAGDMTAVKKMVFIK